MVNMKNSVNVILIIFYLNLKILNTKAKLIFSLITLFKIKVLTESTAIYVHILSVGYLHETAQYHGSVREVPIIVN